MNLGELRQLIKDELSINMTNDVFLTNDILNRFINRAVHWVEDQKPWVQTQKSMKRDSVASKEDYNIPTGFKDRSIQYLKYNGDFYTKLSWVSYIEIQSNYGNGGYTKPVFGVFKDKYFLNPLPTSDGVKDIIIWGQAITSDMTDDAHTHPFTRSPRLEQAIFEYALHLCYRKMRGKYATYAKDALLNANTYVEKEWDEQKRERTSEQTEMVEQFEHIDFLSVERSSERGNFNTF